MELAERLGMTEAELDVRMSGAELHRWKVLDTIRVEEEKKRMRQAERNRHR